MFASSSTTINDLFERPTTSECDDAVCLPRRKMKLKDEKLCGVCGDKALGYNFNAITCESCKAFFRRNALKDKTMVCLFENKCVVDIRTRRFCPACRIKKCFYIGMNRDMILDDSERKKRMSKVIENRAKREPTSTSSSEIHIKTEIDTDDSMSCEGNTELIRPPTPYGKSHGDKPEILFKHIPKHMLPANKSMYYTLSLEEASLLKDLTHAYQETLAAMPEMGPYSEEKKYNRAADLVNHSEICVRKMILFVKYLTDFKLLSQDDQIAALKASVMKTVLLRSALFYIIEKDAWITPKGEIPSSILKKSTGFVSVHNNHVYYCRRVKSMAQDDLHIYSLLQALILFDPAGLNLTSREYVSTIQDKYLILLKHYMESKFSYEYSREYYVSALDRLSDLRVLSEEHAKILLQVNPVDVEPLMLEVLNLK